VNAPCLPALAGPSLIEDAVMASSHHRTAQIANLVLRQSIADTSAAVGCLVQRTNVNRGSAERSRPDFTVCPISRCARFHGVPDFTVPDFTVPNFTVSA
jgi:hypothetical protein